MKILLAPDSLKNSLSASKACDAMREGALRVFPDAEILSLPGGDGGEGTLNALACAWGDSAKAYLYDVHGLCGEACRGRVLLNGRTAVIECADAAGLPKGKKDVMNADSFGVGELIRRALFLGSQEILVCLGGSGCSDGGLHMLRALGLKALDEQKNEIPRGIYGLEKLHSIDAGSLDERLKNCRITILTDVSNPLCGPDGAVRVYGPQKGVTQELMPRVERAMERYAAILDACCGQRISDLPGSGAAGGMGAALMGLLGAKRVSGAEAVLQYSAFDRHCETADLVLTAEGALDRQTVLYGKFPAIVARHAAKFGVPVMAFCGCKGPDAQNFLQMGLTAVIPLPDRPMNIETSMKDAATLLTGAVENALRCCAMGLRAGKREMNMPTEKLKLLVMYHGDTPPLEKLDRGDWIDLRAAESVDLHAGEYRLISLGVSMRMPEGYEAHIVPRSSTYKRWGLLQANHMGVVDESYSGSGDIWRFSALATRDTHVEKGDRICQFRLEKKMPEIEIVSVDELTGPDRGGIGSTGRN